MRMPRPKLLLLVGITLMMLTYSETLDLQSSVQSMKQMKSPLLTEGLLRFRLVFQSHLRLVLPRCDAIT